MRVTKDMLERLRAMGDTTTYGEVGDDQWQMQPNVDDSFEDIDRSKDIQLDMNLAQTPGGGLRELMARGTLGRAHPSAPQVVDTGMGLKGLLSSGTLGMAMMQPPMEAPKSGPAAVNKDLKSAGPKAAPKAAPQAPATQEVKESAAVPTEATKENISEAQRQQAMLELTPGISRAGALIAAGIAGTKPAGTELFDQQIKEAKESGPEARLAARIAIEKKDPKSAYSEGFRQFLTKFGVAVPPEITAEQVEKVAPWMVQKYNNDLARATQKDIMSENRAARAQQAEADRALRLQIAGMQSDARTKSLTHRDEMAQEKLDAQAHRQTVNLIKRDKPLQERLKQYQNLDNALAIITRAKNITPQQIHEFQQAVRSNLGIKGGGGVSERQATYLDSLGLRASNWVQFLTGNPAHLSKDTELMRHLKDLATIEQENVKGQVMGRIDAVSGGYGSMYERREDLRKDLEQLTGATRQQFSSQAGGPAADKPKGAKKTPAGKVKVLSPEGLEGFIPSSRLDAYMANGYKKVE